jgi:antibiotic biosynthesis monooxygenase (ABM) superfamily enzyme
MQPEKDTLVEHGKSVTVVVSRMIFPGHEKDYDAWLERLAAAAKEARGNIGVTILRPAPGKQGLHHVVFYFKDKDSVHEWEDSYIRQKLSWEADAFSRRSRQEATGLEAWFSIPECPELDTPPHWKMAIVTFIGVFFGSCAIIALLELFWKKPNLFAFNAVVGVLLVSLLTWLLMPFLSRHVFRRFLYGRSK